MQPSVNSSTNFPGRNRSYPHARSPAQLHWADWKDILKRVKSEVDTDRIGLIAAAVAYYALLSIFPLLIATVSIYAIFADPVEVGNQIRSMAQFIPEAALNVIDKELSSIVQNPSTKLGFSAILSILLTIWTASKATKALMEAMNIAYSEKEERGFIRFNIVALLLTFGAVVTVALAVGAIAILPPVMDLIGFGGMTHTLVKVLRWPGLLIIFLGGLAILNRYGPSREKPQWRWISVGGLVTTLLILIASFGFAYYAEQYGEYNKTYGSLAGVIILLLWLYIVSYAVLLGVEINAEVEHQTTVDSTTGPAAPMGQRGAVQADTTPD